MAASPAPPTGDLVRNLGMIPLLGVKPVTLWFAVSCSIHWATPARAVKKCFKRFYLFIFRERGREGKREDEKHQCERETSFGYLSYVPPPGTKPQPRHVHWLVMNRATFRFGGQYPTHWATEVRAVNIYFLTVKMVKSGHQSKHRALCDCTGHTGPWNWSWCQFQGPDFKRLAAFISWLLEHAGQPAAE